MIHFAFPNVDTGNDKFLGCGRYVAVETKPGQGYTNPRMLPHFKAVVERTASLLAYQPSPIRKTIYWKKDRSDQSYVGPSKHLAYFLTLIHRTRALKDQWTHDIWCTGAIEIVENYPTLQAVSKHGFRLKLQAFLTKTNLDQLFIVPIDNIQPFHKSLCQQNSVPILSLQEFRHHTARKISVQKVVVTVFPDELNFLLCVLFQTEANPFKGLSAFQEEDADYFFGREELSDNLWHIFQRLYETPSEGSAPLRLMTILGPSGSGKSSVARAGLIRKIRASFSLDGKSPKIAVFTPGEHPVTTLAKVLAEIATSLSRSSSQENQREQNQMIVIKTGEFKSMLYKPNESGERDGLTRIVSRFQTLDASPLVLLIDQGEELYTQRVNDAEHQLFTENLLHAASTQIPCISIVLTLRSDFLDRTQSYPEFNNAIARHEIVVPVMHRTNLRRVIEQPARLAGYRFPQVLIDRLITETEGYLGSLPLLEFALTRIWEKLVDGIEPDGILEKIGGIGGALAERSEEFYNTLGTADKEIAQQIFLELISPGNGEGGYTRRRAHVSDLVAYEQTPQRVEAIVKLFSASYSRLLTISIDSKGRRVIEITHEALIANWQRLQDWIIADRQFRLWRERLKIDLKRWKAHQKLEDALLQDLPLTEAENWLKLRGEALNQEEHQFILAGLELQEQESTERENQRQRELALARKAEEEQRQRAEIERQRAEEQKRATRKLRHLLIIVGTLAIIAIATAIIALYNFRQAKINEIEALNETSKAFFSAHNELPALIAGVKAGIKAKQINVPRNLKYQTIFKLQEIIYNIHEKNRLIGDFTTGDVIFSPDGTLIASTLVDGIKFWNVLDGKEMMTISGGYPYGNVAFSPNGKLLALAGGKLGEYGVIKFWNVSDWSEAMTLHGHSDMVVHLVFSPNGSLLASASANTIKIWDATTWREVITLHGHADRITDIAFGPRGKLFASGSLDQTVKIWSVADWKEVTTFNAYAEIGSIAFSPDGSLLASGNSNGLINIWDIASGEDVAILDEHNDNVGSVAFSPDGTLLASGSNDNSIILWRNFVSGILKFNTLQGHTNYIYNVTFSPDGNLIASRSYDMTIRLWDVGNDNHALHGYDGCVEKVSVRFPTFNHDGTLLASVCRNNTIKIWNVSNGKKFELFRTLLVGDNVGIQNITFSYDGTLLASGHQNGTIKLWNIADGKEFGTLGGGRIGTVDKIEFSPDGKLLASSSNFPKAITLWEVTSKKKLHTFSMNNSRFSFNHDGALFAAGVDPFAINVFNVKDGSKIHTLQENKLMLCVNFSPDSTLLVTGNWDRTITLWNLIDGTKVMTLHGHTDEVINVKFDPNGALLVSEGMDRTVKLWDVKTGKIIDTFQCGSWRNKSVTFNPNGSLLISQYFNKTIKQRNLDLDNLVKRGCLWLSDYLNNPNANLSAKERIMCDDILQY